MENNCKILTILGNNGSGRTTLALKIAKELEMLDKSVCIINFDTSSPLATIKTNYEDYNVSIGYILTKEIEATQKEIYQAMIPITDNISILSYIYGDVVNRYSKILQDRMIDLFMILESMVDYIILDPISDMRSDVTKTCYIEANKVIRIIEPTFKSIAYNETLNRHMLSKEFNRNKEIYVMNNTFNDMDYKSYAQNMGVQYFYELPYLEEIKKNENTPLVNLRHIDHYTKKYNKNLEKLIKSIYKLDIIKFEDDEDIEDIGNNIIKNKENENKVKEIKEQNISKIKDENIEKDENKENNIDIEKVENEQKKEKKSFLFFNFKKKDKNTENNKKEVKKANNKVIKKVKEQEYDEEDEF